MQHDVFLIFNNAMHFNSAGTVYFRQARAISEVAKKVFDLLKSDPEKFELEFSETRRKVGRRNQGDLRDSRDMKSNEISIGVPSKTAPSSSRGTSNRKSLKVNHRCSEIAKHVDARDVELPTVDRRCSYKALSLGEDESTFPTVYGKLKQLEYVNQQDVGYRDSLMLFVKDLGPTVQNIAKRKLLGCEIHTASTSAPCRPYSFSTTTALNRFDNQLNEMKKSSRETIDLSGGKHSYINDKTDNVKVVGGTLIADRQIGCSPLEAKGQGNHNRYFKVFSDSYYLRARADHSICSDHEPKQVGNKSMMMLLDKSKFGNQEQLLVPNADNFQANNVLKTKLENKCRFQSKPWPFEGSDFSCFSQDKSQMPKLISESVVCDRGNIGAPGLTKEISCSSEGLKKLKSEQSFVLNMPYLRTRLDQMNSSDQEYSVKSRPFSEVFLRSNPTNNLYSHNHQH
ncbi:putative chromatin remodeler Bromodomain family [Lupinus albus]|uniref:Putative chromatin remodeler Bromodomain family n=1 Tax=Lupinus albus TaxID=3870 RepID=A0A6A4R7F0_LUPAL|nr:putative chromatin remodeler Bromodomain family [Lupinus albus]